MRTTLTGFSAVLLLAMGHAQANPVSLAGLDVEPSLGLTVFTYDNLDAAPVTGLTFDFTYSPTSPSWSEELAIQITAPDGSAIQIGAFAPSFAAGADYCDDLFGSACDYDFGGTGTSDALLVTGLTVPFAVASGLGTWTFEIGEGFDDAPFPDGRFDDGSQITLETTVVPIPAAAWLFGSALLGLAGLRRRA